MVLRNVGHIPKPHHLHLFVNVKASNKLCSADVAIGAEGEYGCRHMKDDGVDDDHPFCPPEGPCASCTGDE